MVGAEEVPAEHVESIAGDLEAVLLQVLTQKVGHQSAATHACLAIVIIECLGVNGLEEIVSLERYESERQIRLRIAFIPGVPAK